MIKLLRSSYSSYTEDNLCILYSQYFFQIAYDRYLLSIIRLVLSLTFYKFIVWACWAKTQSYSGSKSKLVLTSIKQKSFPLFHFSSLPTKYKWRKLFFFLSFYFSIISQFFIFPLFHFPNQTYPKYFRNITQNTSWGMRHLTTPTLFLNFYTSWIRLFFYYFALRCLCGPRTYYGPIYRCFSFRWEWYPRIG